MEIESGFIEAEVRLAYMEACPSLTLSIATRMRSLNTHSLIGPNDTIMMVGMEPLWLVGKDANEDIAMQL